MKSKPKILTIVLILLVLYLIFQAYDYYMDKNKTYEECWALSEKIVVDDSNNTETWSGWQKWTECNQEYINQYMMYNSNKFFAIIFIFLIILSWKLDNLNKKG